MKVLVAIDGSAPANLAVEEVAARDWPAGSQLRLLCIVQPPPTTEVSVFMEAEHHAAEEARQHVQLAESRLQHPWLTVDSFVLHGDPGPLIVTEAGRFGADLIVMGSHGRTGLRRFFMGSVAEYVVRHAPCSVEIARGTTTTPPFTDAQR